MNDIDLLLRGPYFDAGYYGEQAALRFEDRHAAAIHYHEVGWREGLDPSRLFDSRYYLSRNADVRSAGLQPLAHYLRIGIGEGRRPRRGAGLLSARPTAPPRAAWAELANRSSMQRSAASALVDVIVPAYRGHDDTLACIHSVLASANTTPYEIVVIDDCSPERELAAALDAIAAQGLIRLIRNDANQGFVRTAAMAMTLHRDRDVILLNADTVVAGNWIDRLRAHRLGKPRVGTITPWSNNATIMSYPFAWEDNNCDLEIAFAELDRLAADALAGVACEIPTGVGFCFYVSRPCIDDIGGFDTERFGRGYGEENDFCLRAAARGWSNLAACDVFVRHTGAVSFQADTADAMRLGAEATRALHPGYDDLIAAFMRRDALHVYRRTLDLKRLARWGGGKIVLRFEHRWGAASNATGDGQRIARLRASADDPRTLAMHPFPQLDLPNLPSLPLSDVTGAARILADLRVAQVRMHVLLRFDREVRTFVRALCAELGVEPGAFI